MVREHLNVIVDGEEISYTRAEQLFPEKGAVNDLIARGALSELISGHLSASFVGVSVAQKNITAFFPKGLSIPGDASARLSLVRLVLKALRKYSSEARWVYPDAYRLTLDPEKPNVTEVAFAQWLIEDYRRYGLYQRKRSLIKKGGLGQIAWQETIYDKPAYLIDGQPVYLDVFTRGSSSDNSHAASRLHLSALAYCVERYGVLFAADARIFDHEIVEPMPIHLARDLAARVVGRELSRVFSDRAIRLMKLLRAFFGRDVFARRSNLEIYGTSTFQHVWEAVCGTVIGSNTDNWINRIPLPTWTSVGGASQAASTLRPDIIRDFVSGSVPRLLLVDAKYYRLSMPPELHGNPGVNDVSKQLLYEIFLREEAKQRKVIFSGNAFIFPGSQAPLIRHAGEVGMHGLKAGPVQVYFLSVFEGLKRYIEETEMGDADVASEFRIAMERASDNAVSNTA